MIKEFWDVINNRTKVSVNILSNHNVRIEESDGKRIIVITVPRAQRYDKPVYIGDNPFTGSYRRNGEGDYRCTREEVQSMIRDASARSQDSIVLENMALDVFDYDSIRKYRNRMANLRPGHVWESLGDDDFLYKLGAVGRGESGTLHPTAAGLLMFGYEYEIVREFPNYFLDYREESEISSRWADRIVSSSGDWSGNLFEFYFRIYNKLTQDIKTPFKVENGSRIDDTPAHIAIREALANCVVNADYHGRQGIVIIKNKNRLVFSNPGNFRLDIETAKSGGISDPRNTTLIKMFNLISVGERAGSGIPNIFYVWHKQGLPTPSISEQFEPDRTTLILPLNESSDILGSIPMYDDNDGNNGDKLSESGDKTHKSGDKTHKSGDKLSESGDNDGKSSDKTHKSGDKLLESGDKTMCPVETLLEQGENAPCRNVLHNANGRVDKTTQDPNESRSATNALSDKTKTDERRKTIKSAVQKEQIISLMTERAEVKSSDVAELLGINVSRAKVLLSELKKDDIIVAEGENRNRVYRLKR